MGVQLVSNELGLWWSASVSLIAAVLTTIGGFYGVAEHRWPRLFLAGATWVISLSYWIDILAGPGVGAEMRRGGGFVLWPALAFTAWSGVRYSRGVVEATSKLLKDRDVE